MNKMYLFILLLLIVSPVLASAKELDSSKYISSNSTQGMINFNSTVNFSSVYLNGTDNIVQFKDINIDGNYTWLNIGFANDNSSNNMSISKLKELHVNYNSTIIGSKQRVSTPNRNIPISVVGGTFIWDNSTKIITITVTSLFANINWGGYFNLIPLILILCIFILAPVFLIIVLIGGKVRI